VKEVTPDEYRSAQSANQLDVGFWLKGQPQAIVLGNNALWVPPFDGYFDHRTGMLWAEWIDTKGSKGVEPPDYVMKSIDYINDFQSATPGSAKSAEIGEAMVANMVSHMLFIGVVQAPNPVYHRNALENFPMFKTWSYEYYRTYPYRPQQWWLSDES
jgi:peptide/nickel transport system substrate-binding protein